MAFAKGAISRHILRSNVKKQRTSLFGSRKKYRANKRNRGSF